MYRFAERAYPLCRSLTGDGVRETLGLIQETLPLEIHEVPTGTPVLDWTVPKEWNLKRAWIKGPGGEILVDSRDHNLHVLGYSVPVRQKLSLEDLQEHLYSLEEQPDVIPYRTSYYRENWGFCLPHRLRETLPEGEYEVCVEATLDHGSLTYGEFFLPGESQQEVLLSTHCCHPSLANDNLSGLAVVSRLAAALGTVSRRRYSYRFVFVPGTIGSITWLAKNEDTTARVSHGLVAANLGDSGPFHYKKSRQGDAEIDRVVSLVLRESGRDYGVEDFVPFGYDERQYCSPGFDLPVGSLTRTPYGRYAEYHTSRDDLSLVQPKFLAGSLRTYLEVMAVLEGNTRALNLNPKGEPQLGRRGLYRAVGGEGSRERELALLWVLNLSDGSHSLLDVAERSGIPFATVRASADALLAAGLLRNLDPPEEV
ncbi:MAG: DUF4910 domain-containing protein [Deltaproteobacteria bacterium]|nr:DUF4910 domain-containing protein [Deltaproteobacteria bacterium]